MQRTGIEEKALALLQNKAFMSRRENRAAFQDNPRFQLLMPVPGHNDLGQVVVIAGNGERGGSVPHQLMPIAVGAASAW